jgi:hypothetical protein
MLLLKWCSGTKQSFGGYLPLKPQNLLLSSVPIRTRFFSHEHLSASPQLSSIAAFRSASHQSNRDNGKYGRSFHSCGYSHVQERTVNRITNSDRLVIRWTIGDVHPRGFEMLMLSVTCAHQIFGDRTRYVVSVNSTIRSTNPSPS